MLLTSSALTQSKPDPSLAPCRSAAHKAFTEELARADQPLCPNPVAPVDLGTCLDASLKRYENHLAAYRNALRSSIVATQKMLGLQSFEHFRSTERLWDLHSEGQLKATADIAVSPELAGSAEEQARIDLIRDHLRTLDRIYYILLRDDCGACLVDH